MICNQCGATYQANTGFCPSCGATVDASASAGDWNGAPVSTSAPVQSAPMQAPQSASMDATGTLVPVCRRRGALLSSAPWIAALVVCVGVATGIQLSRNGGAGRASVWAVTQQQLAQAATTEPPAAPAAPAPVAAAAEKPFAWLTKITDVNELLRQPDVAEKLKRLLGTDMEEFQRNLSVSSLPVVSGDTITFTTCAPQACGVSEAAISMDADSGTLIAAILANNHIRFYGAKSNKLEDCPGALQSWAQKLAQGHPGDFTYEMRSAERAGDSPSPSGQE